MNLMREKMIELNKRKEVPIDIMPYHNYGTGKYVMTHRDYELPELKRPSKEILDEVKMFFEDAGITCEVRMGG